MNDASVRRTGAPSLTLLQDQCQRLAQENAELRDALFGIVKEQGRVRLLKATVDSLSEGDVLVPRELPDRWIFEMQSSNMVTAAGVTAGKANEPPPSGAA